MTDDLLTVAQAAQELDVSQRTVRRRIDDGTLDAEKHAGVWLIRASSVEEAKGERERTPA